MNDMFGIIVQLTRGPLLKVVSFLLFNLIKRNIIERKVELLKAWLMSEVKAGGRMQLGTEVMSCRHITGVFPLLCFQLFGETACLACVFRVGPKRANRSIVSDKYL